MRTNLIAILFACALPAQVTRPPAELVSEARATLTKDPAHGREAAERLLREAVTIWRKAPPANKEPCADAAVTLSLILLGDGRSSEEVRALVDEALAIYETVEDAKLALALEVKAAASDSALSEPLQRRAMAIRTRIIRDRGQFEDGASTAPDEAIRISETDGPPKIIQKQEPVYPEPARLARRQGSVALHLNIDTTGRPRNIRLIRSLGFGLDKAAYEAVKTWRFNPAIRQGQPVPVLANVEVNFRLL